MSLSNVQIVVLTFGVAAAAAIDLRTRRIPNVLTAAMAALGLATAAAGIGGSSMPDALVGLGIGAALMLPGYVLGATGAGDVKLMAAVGAVVGTPMILTAFLCTALAGGALAVLVALRRRRLGVTLKGTGRLMGADGRHEILRAAPSSRFAYGPAIAAGSAIAAFIG